MYWLKKLRQALLGKKAEKKRSAEQEKSCICKLISLQQPIVHPTDLTEGLGIAIAYHTLGPTYCRQIKSDCITFTAWKTTRFWAVFTG